MTAYFTIGERALLIEALRKSASRHESEARYNPQSARPHDLKAEAMRKLAKRLEVEQSLTGVA